MEQPIINNQMLDDNQGNHMSATDNNERNRKHTQSRHKLYKIRKIAFSSRSANVTVVVNNSCLKTQVNRSGHWGDQDADNVKRRKTYLAASFRICFGILRGPAICLWKTGRTNDHRPRYPANRVDKTVSLAPYRDSSAKACILLNTSFNMKPSLIRRSELEYFYQHGHMLVTENCVIQ